MAVTFNFEFSNRLRAGFIGCGGHAFRNILPVFQYAPVELVAVCDLVTERAEHFRRLFGAATAYDDHRRMLEREELDAVFIVTSYDELGRPRYPALASDCLRAGRHVWVEKPPVGCLEDVAILRSAVEQSGRKLAVGFKKMFFPANVRARELISQPEFGPVRSVSLRYPQYVPTVEELGYTGPDRALWGRRSWLLDHLCHPLSVLQLLAGRVDGMTYARAENGSGFALFTMVSGATAAIHFTHGQARSSFLERTEVTGQGANVVIENNIRLTYYRPVADAAFRKYGRGEDFTGALANAPVVWEPEFSLGNLYNKGLFLLGYYNEIAYFCDAVLNDRPIERGTLDDAEEGIRVFDAFKHGPGKWIQIRNGEVGMRNSE